MRRIVSVFLSAILLSGCAPATSATPFSTVTSTPSATIEEMNDNSVYTAMSYNILSWDINTKRVERVIKRIKRVSPDLLGVQESTRAWMNHLDNALKDEYISVSMPSDSPDDPGGSCGIFFKRDKFDLLDSGTYWLSRTPDVPSMLPQTKWNRVLVYALLKRKSDSGILLFTSSHIDSDDEMVGIYLDFIASHSDKTVISVGDFNIRKGSRLYKTITSTNLNDASVIATNTMKEATVAGSADKGIILDYFFVTKNALEVDSYEVLTDQIDGDYPSDHNAIVMKYRLK